MLRTNPSVFRLARGCIVAALVAWVPWAPAAAWERPHSSGTNSGYASVTTKAAGAGSISVPNIGSFAPGAGPVVAADGSVYIGNEQGKLMAFRADGSPYWSRDITHGQSIVASPVIDSAGNVYVIGIKMMRDHTVTPTVTRLESTLHKFTASGGWLYQMPFPQIYNGGATTAAPNIWRYNGAEAIMVPVAYPLPFSHGHENHLIAFSTGGQVLADAKISIESPTTYGEQGDITGFNVPGDGRKEIVPPMPTAAIFTNPNGGTPFIIVADGFQNVVGYTFDTAALTEIFRVTEGNESGRSGSDDYLAFPTTPMVMPDGHSVVGAFDGLRFMGPNMTKVPTVKGVRGYAPPTLLTSGKVVMVTGDRHMYWSSDLAVLQDGALETRIPLGSASIASAAASHNQVFVSTADAFITFDATTLQQAGKFDWVGGGVNPPAIGPQGHVYAIASNILFVFPPPRQVPQNLIGQPLVDAVALPPQQTFSTPMTTSGNRLFACLKLDGDDCGKGDYGQIALAWCQKQGYAKAQGYDVEKKKVKAETLDGHFCSKNKCKVFDTIACEM
jgi:hypothetical protein